MANLRILSTWPIRKKLLLIVFLIFMSTGGIIVAQGLEERRELIEKAKKDTLVLVESLAAQQEQIVIGAKSLLSTLAQFPAVQKLDAGACNEIFREINNHQPFYSAIAATTSDGTIFAASTPFEPGSVNLSDRKHFRDAVRTLDFSVGEYILGRVSKVQSINFTYPVRDADKNLAAILIAGFRLDEYAHFLAKVILSEGYAVTFMDHKGVRLFRLPEHESAAPGKPIQESTYQVISGKDHEGTFEKAGEDGVYRIYAYKQLRLGEGTSPYLYMLAGVSKEQIVRHANSELLENLSILGIIFITLVPLVWFFGNLTIAKPIEELVSAARHIGEGKMGTRTNLPHAPDELGQLAKSFDDMASLLEMRDIERNNAEEALSKSCFDLEEKVQERTADLKRSNALLREEITERRRLEEGLRESEEKFRALFRSSPEALVSASLKEGRIYEVNEAYCRFFGYYREELIGKTTVELGIWQDTKERDAIKEILADKGTVSDFECHLRTKSGTIKTALLSAEVLELGGQSSMLVVTKDITERKVAEEALRASEERFRLIAENIDEVFWMADSKINKIIYISPGYERVWGQSRKELYENPRYFLNSIHPDDRDRVLADLAVQQTEKPIDHEYRIVRPDGSIRWIWDRGFPVQVQAIGATHYVGVAMDITDRRRAEEERTRVEAQLRQAQKMEALGTLAGGIAHDFNNILGVIFGYTEIALWTIEDGTPLRKNLQEVLNAAYRAKDLVQQILAFSRRSELERKPVQVGLIVKEAMKMLRASLPSTIDIRTDVNSQAVVLADPTQIHQILMNLCTNAGHAMREAGGLLDVSLTDVFLEPHDILAHSDLQPGHYLRLTVKDTGHGIEPDVLDRIYDPFFTTKEQGVGTGLGLAVVHGIMVRHGGTIEVDSRPGEGATFRVLFPVIDRAAVPQDTTSSLPRGGERILLVDDEPALGLATKQMLEYLGYEVDYRTGGMEALEAFRLKMNGKSFDLVITDTTMPHLTGPNLVREIRKLQQGTPVILCTGFSDTFQDEKAESLGVQGLLKKPFLVKDLAELVRKVLNEVRTDVN